MTVWHPAGEDATPHRQLEPDDQAEVDRIAGRILRLAGVEDTPPATADHIARGAVYGP